MAEDVLRECMEYAAKWGCVNHREESGTHGTPVSELAFVIIGREVTLVHTNEIRRTERITRRVDQWGSGEL